MQGCSIVEIPEFLSDDLSIVLLFSEGEETAGSFQRKATTAPPVVECGNATVVTDFGRGLLVSL